MIRPININLNAAHPELPLVEATTFTGAPSSVFIRGVPKAVGNWSITAVSVAVTYPDNTTTARAAVESAEGVWVATIPGTATSGRTAAGFKIMADGIDENGAAVTGYVLGFADFSVLSFTPVPAPGGTFYVLRYFDQAPATPKEGDVAVVDGLLKMYNGTAWRGFGDGPGFSTDDPQMDGSASPGSAATAARSDHVHPSDTSKPNKPDAWSLNYLLTLDQYGNLVDSGKSADNVLPPAGATPAMDGTGSAGSADTYSRGDHVHPTDTSRAADDAVVKLTGNQDIGGNKTFYGDVAIADGKDFNVLGGRVAVRSQGGSDVALFEYDRLEYSTDGGMTWTSIMLDSIALKDNIPYSLVTKTISNGAVSLDDRAINAVAVSSSLASLTVNFPTATSGKARDFGLRLTVASGITTAPELALPQGVTCENADGAAPEIGADGAATILYFTETASGVFLVKGEVVTAIS